MPISKRNERPERGSISFARRRVLRRELVGLLLWIGAVIVTYGTLTIPFAAHLLIVFLWLVSSGITFIILSRRNLQDTEEIFESSYARVLRAQEDMLIRLAMYSEARDAITGEHLHRVRENATLIAHHMGMDIEDARAIGKAAVVHDIGKVGTPDAILGKTGKLTRAEYDEIKNHTTIGEKMLGQSPLFELERQATRHHHEWWDGTGYPDGLTATNIPLVARITAVADVFDALVSKRPYKEPWELDEALTYLQQKAGVQFDPDVVHAFVRLIHEGKVRGWESAGIERGKTFPASEEDVQIAPLEIPSLQANEKVVIGGRRMRVIATSDEEYEDPLDSFSGDRTASR